MRKLRNEELERPSVEDFKKLTKNNVTILLDNVRSMNNVGSAFRIADAFLAEMVILTGITAQPPHREINKTALGSTESVDWKHFETNQEAIAYLIANQYEIIPIEQVDQRTWLIDFKPEQSMKYCFVFGNEVFGVSDEYIKKAKRCVEIPQGGTKHSLNISVSIGVVMWHYYTNIQ
ncbi:MAG TPA: TrmH family RNA methyltransferase [Cyclobacteriaceae bacterium]